MPNQVTSHNDRTLFKALRALMAENKHEFEDASEALDRLMDAGLLIREPAEKEEPKKVLRGQPEDKAASTENTTATDPSVPPSFLKEEQMELQEFVRRPFPVKAVEVNFQNAYEVAEWCRGRVELKKTRLMGGAGKGEMDLPTVVFKGTGDNRDKEFTAGLGDWIVELRGNFRVFKKAQFRATFEPVAKKPLVEATDALELDTKRTLYEVTLTDNVPDELKQNQLIEQEELVEAEQQ